MTTTGWSTCSNKHKAKLFSLTMMQDPRPKECVRGARGLELEPTIP